jgi:hypothetical protein
MLLDEWQDATQEQPDAFIDDVDAFDDAELLGESGEPHFRQLEPAGPVAAADRRTSSRRLSRVTASAFCRNLEQGV